MRLAVAIVVVALTAFAGPAARAGEPPATPGHAAETRVAPPSDPGAQGRRPSARSLPSGYDFWELQMNLCNSGIASCYKKYNNGLSVGEAAGVIRSQWPDLVTLNEVCRADVVNSLFAVMAEIWPGDWVYSSFMPAYDRGRNAPYLCANGDQYGIGVVGHVPSAVYEGVESFGEVYPDSSGGSATQDTASNEKRSWVCAYAVGAYYGCTTHLASTSGTVAANQCRYLMSGVVPSLWAAPRVAKPSVVGGDLNLKYKGSPDAQKCVPPGWFRKGDGDVQHVMATSDLTFGFSQKIDMKRTDHDAWLVALVAP
ncbi:hypothetical protein [Sphaerisporangium corydalis]|uniref:Endonuclease/exonuclease/phosphatase family protein n=1 Tax=Sphaerisporangium corydalis TaxID=1441875 RepID=A0ABV9EN26_9ACTN|nr:hypothetical protein [Sphaerisporangium corydalis]